MLIILRRRKFNKQGPELNYNVNTRQRQFSNQAGSLNSDHLSFATTTESSDILTYNSKQQNQPNHQHYFNNASSTSTSSSIIDRSDLIMLNRTLNDNNPSIHVYETISVYGKNNEIHQAKLVHDVDFFNNLILKQQNCIDNEPLSKKIQNDNNLRTFKQNNSIKHDKAYLTTFYNNFEQENQIKNSKKNKYSNDIQNEQPFQNLFLNVRTQNKLKPNTQNLFLTEAIV